VTGGAAGAGPGVDVGSAVEVVTAGGIDAELAADALWRAGAAAIEERERPDGVVLLAGPPPAGDPDMLVAAVAERWPARVVAVDLGAALDAWRPHARSATAGRFVVRPPWLPPPGAGPVGADPPGAGPVEVVVDPGRTFGSGAHASTRLALLLLGDVVAGGERVLDVGSGSGVLAVAALVAGAAGVAAVDVDPAALDATRANAARNGVAHRLAVAERVDRVDRVGDGFDLVVANMLAPVLVELAPAVAGALRPGGTLVLSGFLAGQRAQVLAAYPQLTVTAEQGEDGWLALRLRRS
jgi:ribosomal protein L11 methyltransferase